MNKISTVIAGAMMLSGLLATAQAMKTTGVPEPVIAAKPAFQPLTISQQQQLQSMIAQHNRVRAQLSASDRSDLDKLTARVRQELFAAPLRGNLLSSAAQIVGRTIPGLTAPEAASLAEFTLGGIAAATQGGAQAGLLSAARKMHEAQIGFNQQFLQLKVKLQSESQSFTAISGIMRTKHDTVKNSIGNIR